VPPITRPGASLPSFFGDLSGLQTSIPRLHALVCGFLRLKLPPLPTLLFPFSHCVCPVLPGFRGVASAAAAATAAAATAGSAAATTIAFPALSVLQAFLIPTLTFTNFGFAGITLILVIAAPLPFLIIFVIDASLPLIAA